MDELTQYVDPFIGTDDSNCPRPVGGGAGGSTYPGADVPFGMVQFSPDTPSASPSGYRYSDTIIEDFSLTHFDGAGCPNNEDLNLLPVAGDLALSPGIAWNSYVATQDKTREAAQPGYYKTRLSNSGIDVELTATARTGMMRLISSSATSLQLLISASRSAVDDRTGTIDVAGRVVSGQLTGGGFCGSKKTYPIYFAIALDHDPSGFGTWQGPALDTGSAHASGTASGAYLNVDARAGEPIQLKVGWSYVSVSHAQQNLLAENSGWDFDATRRAASSAWNTALNRILVTGGEPPALRKFYTALYRVQQSPTLASDVDGSYVGFDAVVHTSSRAVYQNYSGWDIYRSWAALLALIAPEVMSDIAASLVLDGQQGGLLPKWSQQHVEDFVMNGDPGPIIVASAYAFGTRGFDAAAALALMKASQHGALQGVPIRTREAEYAAQHFVAGDASESLEYAASDFAIAQFARELGDQSSYMQYMERAQWWANSFDPDTSYVTPRNHDGTWLTPLDPAADHGFIEGNAAQYTFMVPHNFEALFRMMGGWQSAVQRLDHHFTELNAGLGRPYFYIGNEPEHGVPWAYHFAGQPARTASAVRRVMADSFTDGPGGLPGNDDLGATSAWYVWAALGMYPVTPGADTLALHGPSFPLLRIRRAAGDIELRGGGRSPFVQSLAFEAVATTHSWLRYGDIASGATLTFSMGDAPSTWGTAPSDVPPSFEAGWTPPSAAAPLGANLAVGKPALGSSACASGESAAKAFDAALANDSKWCSKDASAWLQVDLGAVHDITSFVIAHAGLGGEVTDRNTRAFTLATSLDAITWRAVVTVTDNTASRTYHSVASHPARYVRLTVQQPGADGVSRIYELEVHGRL